MIKSLKQSKKEYDFLIVGAGLFGSVCAFVLKQKYRVLVIDKRNHIGGNCYTVQNEGIVVHKYGPHIFHTNNLNTWNFVSKYVSFGNYKSSIIVNYKGTLYPFPFNMWTYNKLWGATNFAEATQQMNKTIIKNDFPKNFEEYAISRIGRELYEIFVKGYTQKQWGKPPNKLPVDIFKRLPIRSVFQNNYYVNAMYEGIPENGYTPLFENLLEGCTVKLNTSFDPYFEQLADKVIYTGCIDEYYNNRYGKLEYRSLVFEEEVLEMEDFQSNAIVNFTDENVPFTRIIEHKHFSNIASPHTIITREFPSAFGDPYYPIGDTKNLELYRKYESIDNKKVVFGGRLGSYKYINMDETIEAALALTRNYI